MRLLLKIYLSVVCILVTQTQVAQSIANGNFSSGTTSWGCGAETNPESVYGGASSNPVAEVDAAAGLCQTVTGLTIGNTYYISFSASRRTGGCPSPVTTNVNLTVSGGVLSTTITRTNTTFGFTTSSFLFTANATSHTINFSAGAGFGSSTCGMIIDNISMAFSPLPVELIYFKGYVQQGVVNFEWATMSEKNNDFFEIQRSEDGIDYEKVIQVKSQGIQGNSQSKIIYRSKDSKPFNGDVYYRLKQVDFDKSFSTSKVIAMAVNKENLDLKLYPNPNTGAFSIESNLKSSARLTVTNYLGASVHSQTVFPDTHSGIITINLTNKLPQGVYHGKLESGTYSSTVKFVIE